MGNWYDVEMRIEDKNIIKKIKDCIFINPDALGINKEKLEFDGEEFCHYIDLAYFFGMRDELVGEKDLTTEELNEVNELANWKHYNEFAPGYLFDDEYIQKGYAVLSLKQGGYYPRGLLVYISKLTPLKDVANAIKTIPLEWINEERNGVTQEMIDYVRPLIDESEIAIKSGNLFLKKEK